MPPPFALSFDPDIGAVCVTLTGRWSMETAQDYMRVVAAHVQAAPPGPAPRKALYDVRGSELHSRDIADALAVFHAQRTPDMDRVAFVAITALEGLQAKRISSAVHSRVFATVEDARAWLEEA